MGSKKKHTKKLAVAPATSNAFDKEDYRRVAARDTKGRVLPGCFPSGSLQYGTAIQANYAEENVLNTLRHWQAAENDIDLRARLWAWSNIETAVRFFAQGKEERAQAITDAPHSPKDVVALDALVALWNRHTKQERKTFKKRIKLQKNARA